MAEVIYALCALASVFCAVLLIVNYRRVRLRLALFTSICFVGLAVNNILLFIDKLMLPAEIDLSVPRSLVAMTAILVLVIGMVWEAP